MQRFLFEYLSALPYKWSYSENLISIIIITFVSLRQYFVKILFSFTTLATPKIFFSG